MPINTIPATAEGMPKCNRSEIMKATWKRWRYIRRAYGQWQIDSGIVDASFSAALRCAWRQAKDAMKVAIRRAVLTALEGTEAGNEIAALHEAIEGCDRLSFRYDANARRKQLQSRINQILKEVA